MICTWRIYRTCIFLCQYAQVCTIIISCVTHKQLHRHTQTYTYARTCRETQMYTQTHPKHQPTQQTFQAISTTIQNPRIAARKHRPQFSGKAHTTYYSRALQLTTVTFETRSETSEPRYHNMDARTSMGENRRKRLSPLQITQYTITRHQAAKGPPHPTHVTAANTISLLITSNPVTVSSA